MRLLVAGSARVDAGKTTFSVGLLDRVGGVGFKPRAGNDYWFDHDDYRLAVERGRLYGKDAKRLAAASAGEHTPEEINPIHRLWTPAPGVQGLLGQQDRAFLVDRVRAVDGDRSHYVVNGTADVPDHAREHLPLADAPRVEHLAAFNDLMADWHAAALDDVAAQVRATDRAVVESYADIAHPLRDVAVDAVAVVEPTRARIYDGRRYAKACEVASGSAREGQLEERVPGVVDLVDPVATTALPALGSDVRADPAAVADAYEHAYDALLAAALE
ncbi:MAG: ATPase [Haloarculaceae archaeon]